MVIRAAFPLSFALPPISTFFRLLRHLTLYSAQTFSHVIQFTFPKSSLLTLSDAGGGSESPPYHIYGVPQKKLMGKVANFF